MPLPRKCVQQTRPSFEKESLIQFFTPTVIKEKEIVDNYDRPTPGVT